MIVQGDSRNKALYVAAVSDVHSPRYLDEFRTSISTCRRPDVFLLAGDMIESGSVHEYKKVADAVNSRFGDDTPIVACFGNEENRDVREEVVRLVGHRIKFLEDTTFRVDIGEAKVVIVGASPVVPDRVVSQVGRTSSTRKSFEKRAERLSKLLAEAANTSTHTILLVHYSPLVQGARENHSNAFSWWVSKIMELARPDVIVHGHVHNAAQAKIVIDHTTVLNVAFPLVKDVTEFPLQCPSN